MSLTISVPVAEINHILDEIQGDVSGAVRPAAQAGAQVLYEEVKRNVEALGKVSGKLRQAIYQAFSKDNSVDGKKATYHISWNAKKAPHAHLVEYGHIQSYPVFIAKKGKWAGHWVTDKKHPLPQPKHVGAHPFIRPAMAKFDAAAKAMADVIERAAAGEKP